MKPATPLPWSYDGPWVIRRLDDETEAERSRILIAELAFSTVPDRKADAAYIVHACNAYPKLVEAMRKLLEAADEEARAILAAKVATDNFTDPNPEIDHAGESMIRASVAAQQANALLRDLGESS